MRTAPDWFIQRFKDRYDITSPTVIDHLTVLWIVQKWGQKKQYTNESVLGDDYEDALTQYGQKEKQRRRHKARLAKVSRRANQVKSAVVRRKRQKRNKRHT